MKTNEFIREMQSLGYETTNLKRGIVVNDDNGFFLAYVSKEEFGVFSTDFPGFSVLDNYDRLQLLDSLVMYAKTPVSEREEEKKYYLKIKFSSEKETYLCAYDFWSDWKLIDKDELKHGDEFYFKYTQKQIDNMPECYKHPAVWKQIEVESEEE